jgi:hypothetical protein
MASTIKVNNIQNQCGANIINESANTITIGASGDTISLASGASQTGFGRTGTVDWDTTAKTASFTAVSGNGYFVNTTSGAITVTLPATPSAGDIVSVKDYAGTAATNAITIARNGSNIRGAASDFELNIINAGATFVYVDGTEGWQVFADGSNSDVQTQYIVATGGTITCCGDYKIHTFTSPGTFSVSQVSEIGANNLVSYTVVGGGGGGGRDNYPAPRGGAGGGAGGFREYKSPTGGGYTASPLEGAPSITVSAVGYPITVGAGGAGGSGTDICTSGGDKGSSSIFSTTTSAGGGGGSGHASPGGGGNHSPAPSTQGASGGGYQCGQGPVGAGLGNQPPTSPPQGQNAGAAAGSPGYAYGGGGGAGGTGGNAGPSTTGGTGGVGVSTSITGSSLSYSGGGGSYGSGTNGAGSPCGTGGGASLPVACGSGTANTGGAGGGNRGGNGNSGGSGIVIIRYKFQ